MSILFISLLILITLFAQYIPINIQSFFYNISLLIQNLLILIVPIIILVFIFRSIILMRKQNLKLAFLLIGSIYLSNFLASFISFNLGNSYNKTYIYNLINTNQFSLQTKFDTFWDFNSIPQIISNDTALILGTILGIIIPHVFKKKADELAEKLFTFITKVMQKIFPPIIPPLIIGLLFQLQQYNIFKSIIMNELNIIRNLIFVSILYVLSIYIIFSKFIVSKLLHHLNNMVYPAIIAFVSMSSTVALPYTIQGIKKNITHKSKMIVSLVPAITNMHLLGDCLLIPGCIVIILKIFNFQITYTEFIIFLTYFALMKFTVITIPGGGIITILPLLKAKLSFNAEMLSLITAFYLLLDPFLAFLNVLGNGGFCLMLNQLNKKTTTNTNTHNKI